MAKVLRFPQERVSEARECEARILIFPERARFGVRFNGLWWVWVWD
jgi:hypothetical protein